MSTAKAFRGCENHSYFWKLKKYWEETWLWCVLKGTGEFELLLKFPWWFDANNSNLDMNFFQISKMFSIFLTDTYLERCGCTPWVKCPTPSGHMTQRSLSWLQADLAEGHMTPRTCTDLRHRNAHWSFIIWSCDGETKLQIQKKHLNLRELSGFTKWWKKKGPKRKKINRVTVGILMKVFILAGGKEDVENALITISPSLESLEGHDRWAAGSSACR